MTPVLLYLAGFVPTFVVFLGIAAEIIRAEYGHMELPERVLVLSLAAFVAMVWPFAALWLAAHMLKRLWLGGPQ